MPIAMMPLRRGVTLSSAGLAALMYGLVQAGENGWGDPSAVVPSFIGLAGLVAFFLWEARLTARPGGEPLIDLTLFRSRSFSWGIVLAAGGIFGMFGVLFTLPQYLQAIVGLDAQGAGVRFLPAIAGMALGAIPADRIASRIGPKFTVALGFGVLTVGMFAGSFMTAQSSDGYLSAWTFLVGIGAGMGLATAASIAILGSVLNSTYQGRLHLGGLPADAAGAVEKSVFGGIAVARQLGSPQLLDSVRTAFVAGMDDASKVAGVVALAAAVLALAVLPRRAAVAQEGEDAVTEPAGSTGAAATPGVTM